MSTITKIWDLSNNDFALKFNFIYNSENDISEILLDVKSNESKFIDDQQIENINVDLNIETIIDLKTEDNNCLRGSIKKTFIHTKNDLESLAIFANLYTGQNFEYHLQGIILTFAAKID